MAEPLRLSEWSGRPYRVPVAADARPAAVIAGLAPGDHPGALWGDWFGGGALLFRAPLRRHEPALAADGFEQLVEQPALADSGGDLVGGGWLVALGYAPGATTIAFYDSLLRWHPVEGWSFESLGLRGREAADATALAECAPSARLRPPCRQMPISSRRRSLWRATWRRCARTTWRRSRR